MVEWRPVSEWEGFYEVSNTGLVRNTRTGRVKVPRINPDGYARVALEDRYKRYWRQVHRLVAAAFCDGYFEGAVVNHKDCNKLNNNASNLEWVTYAENAKHAHRMGRMHKSFIRRPCCLDYGGGHLHAYSTIRACAKAVGMQASSLYSDLADRGGYIQTLNATLMYLTDVYNRR